MPVKGVNPSYFASMPTVALDPNAHKPDPQYARMLTDAMQNRAQATDRRRENDEANVFKAREQSQQARRDRRSNEISKRNAAVNEAAEARVKSGQDFSQDRLKMADTRDLLDGLRKAYENKDTAGFEFIRNELKKRGVGADAYDEPQADFNKRMEPPPEPTPKPPDTSVYGGSREQFERDMAGSQAAPPIPKGLNPPPTARFPDAGEAGAAPPMRAAPAGPPSGPSPAPPGRPMTSDSDQFYKDMEWKPPAAGAAPRAAPAAPARPVASDNEQFYRDMEWKPRAAAPAPARPMASDDAQFYEDMNWHPPTEKELLDRAIAAVVAREAKPLLPGKSLRRRAAESDQMLSPDDPLLQQKPRAQ